MGHPVCRVFLVDGMGVPFESANIQGRAKERELGWVREVLSGMIGCASAALTKRVIEI